MRYARFVVLVIMLIFLTSAAGCCRWFPVGADDAIFTVTGYAPFDQDCTLHLLLDGQGGTPTKIMGRFDKTYYLSFCTETYTIEAICNGKTIYKKDIKFPSKDTPQPYNLGVIAPLWKNDLQ